MDKYKIFFQKVAVLTANHDIINDCACVKASSLGNLLDKVDPEWSTKVFAKEMV